MTGKSGIAWKVLGTAAMIGVTLVVTAPGPASLTGHYCNVTSGDGLDELIRRKDGEVNAALGWPLCNAQNLNDVFDAAYGGRCQKFQHGMICAHAEIGEAHALWGSIYRKWVEFKYVEFGYPITDEQSTPDGRGRYNHFRGMQYPNRPESSIYWTPQTGAHAIYGAIRDAWAQQGWERGPLGYPTSDEHQDGKYRRVDFERGYIRWAGDTGIEIGQ
jgi:uncharacterized protein with LGFP repeats